MRLSEFLNCTHAEVAAGLTPSIENLDAETNTHTCDWHDEPADETAKQGSSPPSGRLAVGVALGLEEDAQVKAAVLQMWDLFSKGQGNTISRTEYEGLVLRLTRVLLPGLEPEQEQTLAANTWEEDAGSMERLAFAPFFRAMVRLARMWTDSQAPADLAAFLLDLLTRITQARVTVAETGEVLEKECSLVVRFWSQEGLLDNTVPDCEFGADIVLGCKGTLPKFKLEAAFERNKAFALMGLHTCWLEERVRDPLEGAAPSDGVSRSWAPLASIVPMGRAVLVALRQAKAHALQGPLDIDTSALQPAPETALDGAREVICGSLPNDGSLSVDAPSGPGAPATVEGSGQEFGICELLSVGLRQRSGSNIVIVRPTRKSVLYKLDAVRRGLQLHQPSAVQAALPGDGVDKHSLLKLPAFTDVLKNDVAVDPASGLVKPVQTESLLVSGGFSSLAEAFVVSSQNAPVLQTTGPAPDTDLMDSLISAGRKAGRATEQAPAAAFTAHFPPQAEGLHNDDADLFRLAGTSPVALWVMGECGSAGEYKTEVCRRLAQRLGLQWLQPAYLLELAVATPANKRTPLMARCAEQLQRGMTVGIGDALRLALEMMSSARCKTNGYVFDFPSVRQSDVESVADWADKLRELSGMTDVRWEDFMRDDVTLPPLPPDPEPPKPPTPPPDEQEGDGADGEAREEAAAAEAEDAEGAAGQTAEAGDTAADALEAAATGDAGDGAMGEAGGPEDVQAEPLPPPPAPFVPNPLANTMPRRLVVLSMQEDGLAAWRLAQLKQRHAERARQRKALVDAGEAEEEQEEEEEEEEAQELPALEDELFDKSAGDILLTMAPYVALPALDPPRRLPPLPDAATDTQLEEASKADLLAGQAAVVKGLCDKHKVPLLSVHADGRSPEATAGLLEAVTGRFRCSTAPLPTPLEGGADGDPKDLLRLELSERQASRRWSPWKLHCPVSLYEKSLTPGQRELAVEYAGSVLLFADENKQRRFCTWPKLFLKDPPRIDAPGMHLGFVLLAPCGYRCLELARGLRDVYGFDIVDVVALLGEAMKAVPLDAEDDRPADGVDTAEAAETAPEPPPSEEGPRLLAAEKQAMLRGEPLGMDTAVRLIAGALGVERNLSLISKQKADVEAAEKELADAQAEGNDPPGHIVLDEDTGKPIIELAESLVAPPRGFVLVNFPESPEQLGALRDQLRLELEQVIILKVASEDAPEPAEFLSQRGVPDAALLQAALESQAAGFEALEGQEGLRVETVPLEEDVQQQLILIRKLIDPFYPIVEDPSVGMEIPDPEAWNPEDEAGGEEAEGEVAEPPERPVIPWGSCGPYCPVTLQEDFWLFPGQKEQQHVFLGKVYALASEAAAGAFLAEPGRFVASGREPALPPPRILVTGPSGSGVTRQCELLAEAYRLPVLRLEEEWLKRVAERLEAARAAKRAAEQEELTQQPMLLEGAPAWPPRWVPEATAEADEGEEAAPEEQEPADDGLDDEARAALYAAAMRDVLGTHCGACVLDGTFFGDADSEDLSDEMRAARSLQQLLIQARRLPDLTLVLRVKHDIAVRSCLDLEAIDREHQEKVDAYKKLCAEAEAEEREPPDPPEGLSLDDEDERESDRARAKFIERKKLQQQLLKDLSEALTAARAPLQKVSVDRGEEAAHKTLRWHCRAFMEQRSSLLTRHQMAKSSPTQSADMLARAVGLPSKFGNASPMATDAPLFSGRPDALKYATALRGRLFFPRSEKEQAQLLERPTDFIHLPTPSRVMVHPAISICGPPLSGKTALARQLAERIGAVYLSVPEVISQLCDAAAMPCELSREVTQRMRRGRKIPDSAIVQALRQRLTSADVLSGGWVLDDFPLTEQQARLLTEAGIVPHRLLVVSVPESLVFARAQEIELRRGEADADLVQHEQALQRQRLEAYVRASPALRTYYALTFGNARDIDASRSSWATFDQAMEATSAAVSQRLEYYRRTAQGLAARISGMCLTPARLASGESPWRHYCPVSLTLSNELVACRDPACGVEYKSKVYWLSTAEHARAFVDDPESFLQVPLPLALPQLLAAVDRRAPPPCQLEDNCPVALVDRKELVKASGHHVVQYQQKHYNFSSKEAREKFMRRPMRYVQRAVLPNKKPASKVEGTVSLLSALSKGRDGRGIEPADMLTYMQASVAEVICQGLVESGGWRPLYPGKSAGESALIFLARFLKAKNPLNTEMHAAKLRERFEEFLSDCALPQKLKDLSGRKQGDAEDVWTSSDARRYQELCSRLDEIFKLTSR